MKKSPPKVGVSACLLGHQVRYDGGHKRDTFIIGPLSEQLDFVPIWRDRSICGRTRISWDYVMASEANARLLTITCY
jgi:hypothetical protein